MPPLTPCASPRPTDRPHHSAQGSTSGLHHDFHDNLYVLLRGAKTFRLFSPADAPRLYTVGQIARIHANGLINYHDRPPTHADGRELGADRAFAAAERLRAAAAKGGEEEEELDAALDAVLDAEMEGEDEGEEEEEEEEDDGAVTPPWPPGEEEEKEEASSADAEPQETSPPRNFSRVQGPLHPDRGAFPLFPPDPPVEVRVEPGSMLFLPAGWFHEVRAYPAKQKNKNNRGIDGSTRP